MAVAANEILIKGSGGSTPGNSTAVTNRALWLGGFMSSTQLTAASLNNLFDDVSGTENAASTVDYRCIFIHNSNATDSATSGKLYLSSETSGGAVAAIGLDGTGVVAYNTASTMAVTIANENAAPSGVTFSAPTTDSGGITVATLAANQVVAVWVRRTAANSASLSLDGVVIRFSFDSV